METAAVFACDYTGSGSRSDVGTDLVGRHGDGKSGDACMSLHGNGSEVCIFLRGLRFAQHGDGSSGVVCTCLQNSSGYVCVCWHGM